MECSNERVFVQSVCHQLHSSGVCSLDTLGRLSYLDYRRYGIDERDEKLIRTALMSTMGTRPPGVGGTLPRRPAAPHASTISEATLPRYGGGGGQQQAIASYKTSGGRIGGGTNHHQSINGFFV
jgi:hypothetical protein